MPEKAPLVDAHDAESCHSIVYTSGTAGDAKGVMLTYGNFWASASASALNLGLDPSDRWLACLPLHHVGGLSIPIRSAIYGTAVELHTRFEPEAVNRAVRSGDLSLLSVVPTMLRRMLNADDRPFDGALRAVLVGGGPVPPVLLERATARGLPVVQTYGLTEACSQVTTLAPSEAMSHLGSAGRALLSARRAGRCSHRRPRRDPDPRAGGHPWLLPQPRRHRPRLRRRLAANGRHRPPRSGTASSPSSIAVTTSLSPAARTSTRQRSRRPCLPTPASRAPPSSASPTRSGASASSRPSSAKLPVDLARVAPLLRSRLAGYKIPAAIERFDALPATSSGKIQRRFVRQQMADRLATLPTNH